MLRPRYGPCSADDFCKCNEYVWKKVHFAISRCSILFMTIEPNFILLDLNYLSTYFFSPLCLLFLLEISHCNCEIAYCILLGFLYFRLEILDVFLVNEFLNVLKWFFINDDILLQLSQLYFQNLTFKLFCIFICLKKHLVSLHLM